MRPVTIVASDGWKLNLRVFRAHGSGRGAVVCGHAMMTDGRYFDRPSGQGFASWLATQGYDVYVPDFRGHGESGLLAPQGGRWSFDDLAARDWPALREAAANISQMPVGEVSVIGHSLGGLVTAADAALTGFQPKRSVFLTANVWGVAPVRGLDRLRMPLMLKLVDYHVARRRPIPIRRLRLGSCDESPDYFAQFAVWARTGAFTSNSGLDYESGFLKWTRPAVAVAASGDWMCPASSAARFVGKAVQPVPVVVEGKTSGLPFHPDHFGLITRQEAKPFWSRVARFLDTGRYGS